MLASAVKTITQLFLLLALASLGFAADKARQGQEDDIREAVFRYQIDPSGTGQQKATTVFFLGLNVKDGDPSDEFMKRFANHKPPVRKATASHYVPGKGILDLKTGEQGMALMIDRIKWISDTEVEVEGGHYLTEMSSSSKTFSLKTEKGKWKVTKVRVKLVS